MGKPDNDALGVGVGQERVKLHGEGRLPLGISPPGSGVGIDIGGGDTGVVVVKIFLDGIDHLGVGGGRRSTSCLDTGTAGGGGTVSSWLGSCRGSHRSGIEAGEGTCAAGRRHEGGEVVEIDVAWKTHGGLWYCSIIVEYFFPIVLAVLYTVLQKFVVEPDRKLSVNCDSTI